MLNKFSAVIIALILLFLPAKAVIAQDEEDTPVYIVQPGENLIQIAEMFGVTLQELITANNIIDSNLISEGTRLIIPGIEGISGVLTTKPVGFGEYLQSIMNRNQLSLENFKNFNRITSPEEIYVGSTLVLPENEETAELDSRVIVRNSDSLFTASVSNGINPWTLSIENGLTRLNATSNKHLFYRSEIEGQSVSPFSDRIENIEVAPLPFVQGHTTVIKVFSKDPIHLTGTVNGNPVSFFQESEEGYYYALYGIHALADVGLIPVTINGTFSDGESFSAQQLALLTSGQYPNEEISVEQTTIEQSVVQTENEQVQNIVNLISDQKLWDGPFRFPVDGRLEDGTIGFTSYFGSRRSYNYGQYTGYHGGLDFEIRLNILNIYAPAPGIVAYTGEMNIRGKTVFIDHGQGVYSGYAHMAEISVQEGEYVQTGQIIGQIGGTGRVTGKHLHWDIWVNGTPVDPFDWVENSYP